MIKWNCNFQIPDSTIQVGVAYIVVESFENRVSNCKVKIKIVDDTQEILIKEEEKIIDGLYNDENEIYFILLPEYPDSEIV